jgi:hypothetical protein
MGSPFARCLNCLSKIIKFNRSRVFGFTLDHVRFANWTGPSQALTPCLNSASLITAASAARAWTAQARPAQPRWSGVMLRRASAIGPREAVPLLALRSPPQAWRQHRSSSSRASCRRWASSGAPAPALARAHIHLGAGLRRGKATGAKVATASFCGIADVGAGSVGGLEHIRPAQTSCVGARTRARGGRKALRFKGWLWRHAGAGGHRKN